MEEDVCRVVVTDLLVIKIGTILIGHAAGKKSSGIGRNDLCGHCMKVDTH